MIDIHSHILPGVDDGAISMEMALEMARTYSENGFTGVIATPHYIGGEVNFSPSENQALVDMLNREISKHKLDVKLYLGNEIYISLDTVRNIVEGRTSSLNNTSYVLIEFPMYDIPLYTEDIIYELLLKGYLPIVAHPERNSKIIGDPNILYKYIKLGALAQMNLPSIEGLYGEKIRATAQTLLENKLYQFVGTDAHSNGRRSPRANKAIKMIEKMVDRDYFHKLIKENGKLLLKNKEIDIGEPSKIYRRKSFYSRLFRRN